MPTMYNVTNILDGPVTTAGDLPGSLRQALFDANAATGADTISFDAGFFGTARTITLTAALPAITGDTSFQGTTPGNVVVTRSGPAFGIFNCGVAGVGNVFFSNMTITGGSASSNGAGIFAGDDNVTVTNCIISNNVTSGAGGGIGVAGGSTATIVLTNSTISGNSGTRGGGIYFFNTGTLSMTNSTVSGNVASNGNGGGGVYFLTNTATIRNSTIAANHASSGVGGGISIQGNSSITLQNCTIANNDAKTNGGGINRLAGSLSLESTIVAKNTAQGTGDDINGAVNFAKFDLIGETDGSMGITDASNKTGTKSSPLDPQLGPLANNGGPTQTLVPSANSAAVNAGSNPASLSTDQRGGPFDRQRGTGIDIGAVEAPTNLIVVNANDSGAGSLRQAILAANGYSGAETITFDPTYFATPRTITLTSGEIPISDAVTITGPVVAPLTISGNNASRAFNTTGAPAKAAISFSGLTMINCKSNGGGGAIVSANESISISKCTLSGNSAAFGGGIYAYGYLHLVDSTLSANKALDGGGIYFSGNNASYQFSAQNCTIAGNTATATFGGGAAFNNCIQATVSFVGCTIVGNSAPDQGGGIGLTNTGSPYIILENSIVSGNTSAIGPDLCSSQEVFSSYCAIGKASGVTTFLGDATTNRLLGANFKLGQLANNGGPTLTQLPAADSPLIGQGANIAGLGNDQRGLPRVVGAQCDIGAVEVQNLLPLVVFQTGDLGNGSLRQTIADANALPGADTIIFDSTVFASAQIITLTSGELFISDALTITGPGPAVATVSGNNASRIFDVGGPSVAFVTFTGLTMTNGKTVSSGGAISGFNEMITLTNCVVTNNSSTFSNGGGISDQNGTLNLTDCTISNNSAGNSGGGIAAWGVNSAIVMERCAVAGNTALNGGGIFNSNSLFVENSTVSGNKVFGGKFGTGGGILISGAGTVYLATVRNCTIVGNSSTSDGGGLDVFGTSTALTIQNSTIVNNTSSGSYYAGGGGGVTRTAGSGATNLESSIISGNSSGLSPDIYSAGIVNAKTCAIGSFLGLSNFVDQGGNLLFGLDLKLGPLANNGGPTQTCLPAPDSPIVNAGSNSAGLINDQRGAGFGRSRYGVDIGAVEASTPFVVTNTNDAGPGSLRQAMSDANAFAGMDSISFDPTFFGVPRTITLTSGEILGTDSVNIVGPGANLTTVSGNNASRVFEFDGPGLLNEVVSGLTITHGLSFANAGAIYCRESLTMSNCIITSNNALGGVGGAILDFFGVLTLNDCQVANNSAGFEGAFGAFAGAVIQRSTISGNLSGYIGGFVAYSFLSMQDSTVANNKSNSGAGGVFLALQSGAMTIRNCTISANSTGTVGGGIDLEYNTSLLTVQNCTITNNTAGTAGGGISRSNSTGTISLESTIVSGNTCAASPDLSGTVAAKNCAIGSNFGITTFFNQGGNLANGLNLKLGPLADNGGPTLTQLPAADSPLVNAGSNPSNLSNDQRGTEYLRNVNGGVDIGAIEAFVQDKTPPLVSSVVPSVITVSDAQLGFQGFTLMVNFNEPMDQTAKPALSFPVENPVGSLAFDSGGWLNATQYQAKYDIEDLNVVINLIDVAVTGGKDVAGNVMAPATIPDAFSIDTKNPTVISMVRNQPTLNNLSTVSWTVTFSEAVTGVNAGNFTLFNGGLSGTPIIASVIGGGATWTVSASGYAGEGTLALQVTGTVGVTDVAGNPLGALPVIGPSYSIDAIPPTVAKVQVNDGSIQRSRVTSVTVSFIEPVHFTGAPVDAFVLTGPTGPVTLTADMSGSTPIQTIVTLTFSGPNTDFTSLKDGRYTLTISASHVTDLIGNPLDGNADGTGGDDYQLIGNPATNKLFRLFGDADGNGLVDGVDFGAFRNAFNTNNPTFDFDGNGVVDGTDFGQFRQRFGVTI